ncbi:hypothetical protein SAMN02910357_01434 [Succinivibrio dextrinosolvens]|uniref:hypothetical protein n=1 Tax=Succinivibrio dextrinosolvens TaxID=83771 RepID=UPI0008E253FB|nr:hypothetical protein [Succinivibrio dextrinosolvens]SFS71199.1 hypothetical protein SAMN02910357_01434 [Succinivibrio dextrinosolvens]
MTGFDIEQTLLKYGDIIHLKRPVSKYVKATAEQRASQFMPFDALTGYSDAIDEVDRVTDHAPDFDENSLQYQEINEKIAKLKTVIEKKPKVTMRIFVPDRDKAGGEYLNVTGHLRRIDETNRIFSFTDAKDISFENVVRITID